MYVGRITTKIKMHRIVISQKLFNSHIGQCRFFGSAQCKRLEGKIAVLAGSTLGIGLETARRMAQEGAKVLICSRKEKNVNNALETLNNEGLNVKGIVCHIGNPEDRSKEIRGIDILFINAGVNPVPGPMEECTESAWDKTFDTNVKAPFFLVKESLPIIKNSQGGSIIFMSTIAAFSPVKNLGVYSASKCALLALKSSLASELGQYNIRVNCVAPGYIDTKFGSILFENKVEQVKSTIPLQRIGHPKDISGVIIFLASEDAGYITGETIVTGGGILRRL